MPRMMEGIEFNLSLIKGFNKWLMIQNYSASTRINYCADLRGLACFVGQISLLELKRDHIVEYLRYLLEYRHLARASLARMIFSLRKFYKFLNLGDVVPCDPMFTVKTSKAHTRLPKALSTGEIEQLLAAATTPRDLAVLELFYASGVRRAELNALNCQDVYFDADGQGGSVNVAHGKGDKQRSVLMGRFAAGALRTYLKGRSSGPLFLSVHDSQQGSIKFNDSRRRTYWSGYWTEWEQLPNGKQKRHQRYKYLGTYEELPTAEAAKAELLQFIETQPGAKHPANSPQRLGIKAIERIVKKAARRAGLGNLRPHQLRHSFATHLLNGGANIVYISRLLGHASVVATQRYLHVAAAELKRTHSKFHPSGGDDG